MKVLQPILKYLKDFGFKSLFYKMLISILLCMIVPVLLVGFLSYRNSSDVLIGQAVEQKSKSIEQINGLLSAYFQRIEEATWSQYNNPWIKDITTYPFDYNEMSAILKCMGYMQADINKAGIYDMFLYIKPLDRYITSGRICSNQDFFLKNYGCSLEQSNALTQAMQEQHYNEYIPFMGNFDESIYPYDIPPDEPAMLVLTTIRITGQPLMQVGAVVRRASIESMLTDKLSGEYESLSLMDDKGHMDFQVGAFYGIDQEDILRSIAEKRGAAETGSVNSIIHSDGTDYLVNYIKNPETGYYIVSRIPMSVILEKTQPIKSVVWILSLLALVLSLCVSFLLSVFFYRPVVALLDSMHAEGRADGQKKPARVRKDEYSLINTNYIRMTSEYGAMMELMKKNRAAMIARLFRRLCQSKYNNPAEIQERLQDVTLSYERSRFAVHIISPDGLSQDDAGLEKLDVIYRQMEPDIGAVLGPALDAQVITFTEYEALCVVINHDATDEELARWASSHYKEMFAKYQAKYGISFSVGLGLSVGDLGQLKVSYDQARESIGNRFFRGYGKVHAYETQAGGAVQYTVSQQERLLNAILQGNRQEALEQVVPVLRNFPQGNNASDIKRLMREMLSVVLDALHEENIPPSAVFGEGADIFQPIEQTDSFDRALDHVKNTIERACQWMQENRQKATEKQRDIFMAYIKAHYAEDIMLQTIAQQFHFSPSYFSRYFKMVTGITFIDCVTQVRIQKAKEMLSESGVAIKDVYPAVGYNNYNTFRRAFKKIVGMSPESYKRNFDRAG